MKNWIYILYIGLIGFFAASCQPSSDELDGTGSLVEKAQITFRIALDNLDSPSRAAGDWEEIENASMPYAVIGDEYENQIDLTTQNGLQVLVYSADGTTYYGEVVNKLLVRKATDNGRVYEFSGDLSIDAAYMGDDGTLPCRLMVFANAPKVNHTSLGLTAFAYNSTYIPMWGVQQCTLMLQKGELFRVENPIYLLRSMAKVEVKLADAIKNILNMTAVKVDKYNSQGYVLPTGYGSSNSTQALFQQPVFNPYLTKVSTGLSFHKDAGGAYYIYLPEYKNSGDGADKAVMKVMVDGQEYDLHFKNYSTGATFDIIRNHYYQYIITDVINDVLVADLLYQSMPWEDVDNGNLNFGNGTGNVMN